MRFRLKTLAAAGLALSLTGAVPGACAAEIIMAVSVPVACLVARKPS